MSLFKVVRPRAMSSACAVRVFETRSRKQCFYFDKLQRLRTEPVTPIARSVSCEAVYALPKRGRVCRAPSTRVSAARSSVARFPHAVKCLRLRYGLLDVERARRVGSTRSAVYPPVVSVRNGSPVCGSFKRVRIETYENRRPSLDGCRFWNGPNAIHQCLRGALARSRPVGLSPRQTHRTWRQLGPLRSGARAATAEQV